MLRVDGEYPELISIFGFGWVGLDWIRMERRCCYNRRRIVAWFFCPMAVVFLFVLTCRASSDWNEKKTAQLVDAVVHRLAQLQNLAVTYHRMVDYTPIASFVARWRRYHESHPNWHLYLGRQKFTCRFSFLRGRSLYDRQIVPGGRGLGLNRQIYTFTPQRAESLIWHLRMPNKPMGEIYNSISLPHSAIDLALGLRAWRDQRWLKPADIMKMSVRHGGAGALILRRVRGLRTEWWTFRLRPKLELVEYRDSVRPGDGEHVVSCFDFHSVDGVELPARIVVRFLPYGLHGACVETVVLTDLHYTLGSKSNTASTYLLTFPKGTVVGDARTGQSWLIESRPRKMSDSAIYRLLKRSDNGATGIPGGLPVEPIVKGGVPARPGSRAVKPSFVPVPLGAAAHPVRASGAAGKWFWWTVVFFSMAGFAVVVLVLTRRIRLWKR
ncbi:MAG: hypothetical protein ACYCUV_02160 [Phycisphaerae bacterium]